MKNQNKNPNKTQQDVQAQNAVIMPEKDSHVANQNQHHNVKKESLGPNTKR